MRMEWRYRQGQQRRIGTAQSRRARRGRCIAIRLDAAEVGKKAWSRKQAIGPFVTDALLECELDSAIILKQPGADSDRVGCSPEFEDRSCSTNGRPRAVAGKKRDLGQDQLGPSISLLHLQGETLFGRHPVSLGADPHFDARGDERGEFLSCSCFLVHGRTWLHSQQRLPASNVIHAQHTNQLKAD